MEVFSSVNSAIEMLKQLLSLSSLIENAKAKLLIAEITVALAEVKTNLAGLMEENLKLKEELRKAKDAPHDMVVMDGVYYKQDGDGPFCTGCYDSQRAMSRLSQLKGVERRLLGKWRCPVCKSDFVGAEDEEPGEVQVPGAAVKRRPV